MLGLVTTCAILCANLKKNNTITAIFVHYSNNNVKIKVSFNLCSVIQKCHRSQQKSPLIDCIKTQFVTENTHFCLQWAKLLKHHDPQTKIEVYLFKSRLEEEEENIIQLKLVLFAMITAILHHWWLCTFYPFLAVILLKFQYRTKILLSEHQITWLNYIIYYVIFQVLSLDLDKISEI